MKTVGEGRLLPPLPPLRSKRKTASPLPGDKSELPGRPAERRPLTGNIGACSNVGLPASEQQPPSEFEWGEIAIGRWAGGRNTDTWGVCFKCGKVRRAVDLEYRVLPFNRGEGWACHERC